MGWDRVSLEMVICGWGSGSDCRSLWLDGENHTRLNEYIRDCLVAKSNEIRAARQNRARQFRKFATENPITVPKDFRFSRVESEQRKPGGRK